MKELICKDLTLGYENQAILSNLNFEIHQGDYLCIVGENGAGKTTLMKTMLRLQKPMGGEVIFGEGLSSTEIGYLPQQTVVQKDFPASVYEVVLSGCQARLGFRPFYSKDDKRLALKNMKRLDILDLRKKCYRDLSGGQQQRVLLARGLCATKRILLLDEPVSGLDPKVTTELYELIQTLNREGITIVMISHDIHAALTYADHVLHLGDSIFFGTTEEYKKSAMGQGYVKGEETNV